MAKVLFLQKSTFCRHDRNEDVGLLRGAEVQRRPAAENRLGPIARIVVQERTAAAQFVLEIGKPRARRLAPLVITSADGEGETMAGWYDDRRRPELDVERCSFPRLERLRFIVRVIRPILHRKRRVELAVRSAQPPPRNGSVWI